MSSRDEFSAKVKQVLAARAGYTCSKPECRAATAGPHTESGRSTNVGEAAHITAAAPGGPRYDATLTPEQRSSAENGIWLCATHAHQVDNDVPRFSVELLRAWKVTAESEAAERQGRPRGGVGVEGLPAQLRDGVASLHARFDVLDATVRAPSRGELGAVLAEISDQVDKGNDAVAVWRLEDARRREWDTFTVAQRGKWCTLAAALALRDGRYADARRFLLDALQYQPDDATARANAVVAYQLAEDPAGAYRAAIAAIEVGALSGIAHAAALQTAPTKEAFAARIAAVPSPLRDDPHVVLAIAMRPDLATSSSAALEAARRATTSCPDDCRSWHALGVQLLDAERSKLSPNHAPGPEPIEPERLAEADAALSRALELAALMSKGMRADILLRRADVRFLSDRDDSARADIEAARVLQPDDPGVWTASAVDMAARGDFDGAIPLFRRAADAGVEHARLLLGLALRERNVGDDRSAALDQLEMLARHPNSDRAAAVEISVGLAIELGKLAVVAALLEQPDLQLDPCLRSTLAADAARAAGREADARTLTHDAIARLAEATTVAARRRLARLLGALGMHHEALPIWRSLATPPLLTRDVASYVECAQRIGAESAILEVARAYRDAGVYEPFLLQRELPLLERYDPPAALRVLEDVATRRPDDFRVRLQQGFLLARMGRREEARVCVASPPDVRDVDVEAGAAIVELLAHVGEAARAVSYGYDLLRRFFADHRAHRAFRNAMLLRGDGDAPEVDPANQRVGPGCAVELVEAGAGSAQWCVLEDSDVPASGVPNEVSADGPFARLIIGARAGERVAINQMAGIPREVTVRSVLPKRVWRYQDVGNQWEIRFPDHREMTMIRLADDGKGGLDLEPIFRMLRSTRDRHEAIDRAYRAEPIPITVLADALGKGVIETLAHAASDPSLDVRCCIGSEEEWKHARVSIASANETVVDVTALGTLFLLGEPDLLDLAPGRLLVTHSTLLSLRELADSLTFGQRSAGSAAATPAGYVYEERDPSRAAEAVAAAERLRHAVEERCTVVDSLAVAALDADRRAQLTQLLGDATLDSAVLAAATGRVLWLDDRVASAVARMSFGTRSIWTHAVLREAVARGRLDRTRFTWATARLVGWGYTFTTIDRAILNRCAEEGTWRLDRWPLSAALNYCAHREVRPEDAGILLAELVAEAYRCLSGMPTRRAFLLEVLETLARRDDAPVALNAFGRALPHGFGLNLLGQADAVASWNAWRAGQRHRIVRG